MDSLGQKSLYAKKVQFVKVKKKENTGECQKVFMFGFFSPPRIGERTQVCNNTSFNPLYG